MSDRPNILIAGGGLAGCLVALALAERRPDLRILIVEQNAGFGGQHIWSFFDTDLDGESHTLVAPLVTCHWNDHDIAFPARQRTLAIGYNSIQSSQLDRVMKARLRPEQFRLGFPIREVAADHVVGSGGERMDADLVLDARGPAGMAGLTLGWQKFVGKMYRFQRAHGRARPTIMDARVPQRDGYRFAYYLPFGEREMLIEDTYYSDEPDLDPQQLGTELDRMAAAFGPSEVMEQESGVLPVVIDGDVRSLWNGASAPLLGLRGGFFHPTTGYSLPDAASNALFLAQQADLSPAAVHAALQERAERFWRERGFFRMLNRMLFRAARPEERYRVLEHFYRLPAATVGRFYAARLSTFDKMRILTGKPPVPLGRALNAVRKQAA